MKHRPQWESLIFTLLFFGITVIGCSSSAQTEEPTPSTDLPQTEEPAPTTDLPQTEEPAPTTQLPQKIHILFLGNSYTFTNNLPEILVDLAQAGGHDLQATMLAQGGLTLEKHAASNETLEQVKQPIWDFVVLQEQSVLPSNPSEREQSMYPAVRLLNTEIVAAGAEPILFMTWGRRDGLPQSGFGDFSAMQSELANGFLEIANELDMIVAPVGEAWQSAILQDAQLDLWQTDGSHPSLAGSYLAACVFYAVVYQESPQGLAVVAGLDEQVGSQLQSFAAQTVLGDLARWNIK